MANWFYAAEGKQQGPFQDGQFRDLVARGVVRGDTLVWTEGMAGWQKPSEIPGMIEGDGGPPMMGSGGHAGGGAVLSIDFGILEFTWRSIVLLIGLVLVIPAPWAFVWYVRWIVSCVQVPGRPNMSFTGNAMTLVPWYFGFIVLAIIIPFAGTRSLNNVLLVAQIVLYWLLLKWMIANLASNGQALGLSFAGSIWPISAGICCWGSRSSPSSAGHGSWLPNCAGPAATFRAPGAKSSSRAAGCSFSDERW